MEAGTPKRAAVRLALAGGGVVLTLVLLVVAAIVLVRRSGDTAAVAEAPEWDVIETGASYRLPTAPGVPVTPVEDTSSLPIYSPPLPTYEPPPEPSATTALPNPGWTGPLTIHNPAAFGPPEDDSVPPIPTPFEPQAPAEPRLATAPPAGPTLAIPVERQPTPPTPSWSEPAELAAEDLAATDDEPAAADPAQTARATLLERLAAEPPRPLRDLAPSDEQALLNYTASTNDLSKRLEKDVQAGFQLGKSGAVYAARAKFVGVLRQIALAKDAAEGTTRHAEALAEGLRTLDEADDFVPRGDALEAELEVESIARSHGVRLVSAAEPVAPHEAIAQYSQHAAKRLAVAAADEPAASMALYGLGKSYTRLEAQGEDPTAGRKSAVMYRAAIDAHAQNFLAANELGVRLARVGRYEQASRVLRQAAAQPTSIATVHANLAAIENRLGRSEVALAATQRSERLAQRERMAGEVSRRHGVEWVAPDAFQRAAPNAGPVAPATQPPRQQPTSAYAAAAPQQPMPQPMQSQPQLQPQPQPGGWSGFVKMAKRATGWSSTPQPTPSNTGPPVAARQGRVLR